VKLLVLLPAIAGLCACAGTPSRSAPAPAPAATVRIDGSAGVMPLVAALAREYRALEPSVAIEMGAGLGTKARVDALTQERIDIALASHGVVPGELAKQGIAVHEIARVAVVFGVNASVPVASLTKAQICDVYSGATTNWSRLGGPDLAIAARTRPAAEVDADVVLSGVDCFRSALAPAVAKVVEKPEQMAAELTATTGAIGMTSMPFVQSSNGRIRALALDGVTAGAESVRNGGYPLTRASYLLIRTSASPAVARFLAFVRGPAGARIIVANGGVPVE
jgi:phosphate transport system substrate-binding protein